MYVFGCAVLFNLFCARLNTVLNFVNVSCVMEVINKCSALLSNLEVLEVLKEYTEEQKGAKKTNQKFSTITYETLTYINGTPAHLQTPEHIKKVLQDLEPYNLTKAEKLQLVNLRPTTAVEISLIVEESEERVSEEQIDEIINILSYLPALEEEEEEATEDSSGK